MSDLGGEVGDVGVEGVEESGDGGPADVASSGLDLGDVGVVGASSIGEFPLGESGLLAKLAECSPEGELGGVDGACGLVVHRLIQIGRLYVPAKC